MKIDEMFLVGGSDILLQCGITLPQPKLNDIRSPNVGFARYSTYVNLVALTPEQLVGDEAWSLFDDASKAETDVLALLHLVPGMLSEYASAFSFFLHDDVDVKDGLLVIGGTRTVSPSELAEIRSAILTVCGIGEPEEEDKPPTGKRARAIWEKLAAGRKRKRMASKHDANLDLPNVVSAVAAKGPYNLITIWDLTVWQLYDQFARINVNSQTEIVGVRWAAWGKEDFDFSVWYKKLNSGK